MGEVDKKMAIATFRFGIIADFVVGARLDYGECAQLLSAKASRSYQIPFSKNFKISKSTIKSWIKAYRASGGKIESLMPKGRIDSGHFRTLGLELQDAIKNIRLSRPTLSGVAIVNELKHRKLLGPSEQINSSVLYRYLKTLDALGPKEQKDRRAFEATFANELWQSDVLHGPPARADGKTQKSYLIAVLDDHSRLIVHGQFYFSESLESFKNCLKQAMEKRGLPHKLYIDNGSCFKALNLDQVTACLGVGIVHTPAYTPQGRGKIERWFRYVRENFLVSCPEKLTLEELNERFNDWTEKYHNKVHSTTGQTPLARYQDGSKCIRPAPKDLLNYFRYVEFRRVKQDRTVRLNSASYEVAAKLIGLQVELRFHLESPDEVEVFYESKSFGQALLLDRNINFKIGRNNKVTASKDQGEMASGELFKGEQR